MQMQFLIKVMLGQLRKFVYEKSIYHFLNCAVFEMRQHKGENAFEQENAFEIENIFSNIYL